MDTVRPVCPKARYGMVKEAPSAVWCTIMVYPLEATAPSVEPDLHDWSLAQRIGFRFVCVYLVLYLSDGWLQLLPVGGATISRWWQTLDLWTGRHILHITTEIDVHRFGT